MEGSEADTSRTFRRVLLNTCQEEFEGAAAAREVERCPGTICPQHVATIASENYCPSYPHSACSDILAAGTEASAGDVGACVNTVRRN